MLGRADHHDPFLRYLSGNELRGKIGEVAKPYLTSPRLTISLTSKLFAVRSMRRAFLCLAEKRRNCSTTVVPASVPTIASETAPRSSPVSACTASVLERREYRLCVRKECAPSFGEHGSVSPSFQQGHP